MSTVSPTQSPARPSVEQRRTSSFVGGLIRRTKSTDILGERKASGGRISKKLSESEQEEQLRRQKIENSPPKLPGLPQQYQIQTFGGEDYRPRKSTASMVDAPPVPPIPAGINHQTVDPHARTESMTHRGRYSYANSISSTLNSPRRVRRRKDPTPFNVLIIGARNSGKTSFLNFLKSSLAMPNRKQSPRIPEVDSPPPSARGNRSFTSHYQELEIDNERIGLTLWDSQGLEKSVVDLQLREMSNFVESKFDDTFIEEMKVVRAPGLRDTHIHCVFLILDPLRLDQNIRAAQESLGGVNGRISKAPRITGALDEDFDIQVLRTLQGKTAVIPVISKADTVTAQHMNYLKRTVLESLKRTGLDPLEALNFGVDDSDEDEEGILHEDNENKDLGAAEIADHGADAVGIAISPETNQTHDNSNTIEVNGTDTAKASKTHKREISTASVSSSVLNSGDLPFSILSPDSASLDGKDGPIGRKFPWGFADPYNPEHCDFVKLKNSCFREWRSDLKDASIAVFYERWRTSRLKRGPENGTKPSMTQRKSSGGIPIALEPRKG